MSGIYIASISGRRQLWFCPIATNSHNWIPYSGKRLASWILAPAPVVVPTTGAQSSSLVLWPHSPTLIASIQKISKKEGNLPCLFTSPSLSLSSHELGWWCPRVSWHPNIQQFSNNEGSSLVGCPLSLVFPN